MGKNVRVGVGHRAGAPYGKRQPKDTRRWQRKRISDQRLDWMLATLLEKITEEVARQSSKRSDALRPRQFGELEMDEFRSCLEDFWPA